MAWEIAVVNKSLLGWCPVKLIDIRSGDPTGASKREARSLYGLLIYSANLKIYPTKSPLIANQTQN